MQAPSHLQTQRRPLVIFYIARRVISAISVVFVTIIASFALFYMAPSDPAGAQCGIRCTPARIAEITKSLDLDKPKPQQLVDYLDGLVAGHTYVHDSITVVCHAPCLGYSYHLDVPVLDLVEQAIPVTISIVVGAAVVFLSLGLLTGIFAARFRNSPIDRLIVGTTQVISAIPYFVAALLVVLYVPGFLPFIPEPGYTSIFTNPLSWASGLLLAWLTVGVFQATFYTRYVRATMIESIGEDYVRTARAKGVSERSILFKHALRATLTPIATIFGLDLAGQLTGAVFTESIFGLPGLGLLTIRAFQNYDFPIMLAATIFGSIVLVTANLIVDLLYTVLDPRVRLS
jgi:peptide/nickel transport system permease protein